MKFKAVLVTILVLILLPAVLARSDEQRRPILSARVPFESRPDHYIVKKMINGNTLLLTNGEKVRLIGVETPKVKISEAGFDWSIVLSTQKITRFDDMAKSFAELQIDGEAVRLEYDAAYAPSGHQTASGETLAYVYRVSDDFCLNEALIERGYGILSKSAGNYRLKNAFAASESRAIRFRRGVWQELFNVTKKTEGPVPLHGTFF